MANVLLLAPRILKWEGGFCDDPDDRGGATNKGVTLSTWRQVGYDKDGDGDIDANDVRLLSKEDATRVLKQYYWDRWKADLISNQSVAEILVDWVWCSGKWGIVIPQQILQVQPDGIVGNQTVNAVNSHDQRDLHSKIVEARKKFIENLISRNPSQEKFRKGWMNRINDYQFSET